MLKLNIRLLIALVILLIIPISIYSQEYTPPTDAELMGYWETLTFEQRLAELRKLDTIEHATPIISDIVYGAMVTKLGKLVIFPIEGVCTIKIDYLSYEFNLKTFYVDNFLPKKKSNMIINVLVCSGLTTMTAIICGENKPEKYLSVVILGAIAGIIISL